MEHLKFYDWKVSAVGKTTETSTPRGRSVKVRAKDVNEAIAEGEKKIRQFSLWEWEIVEVKKLD